MNRLGRLSKLESRFLNIASTSQGEDWENAYRRRDSSQEGDALFGDLGKRNQNPAVW